MPLDASKASKTSRAALLALGVATAVLQTLAVREGFAATSGNEAVVAVLFGVWMLETALGASVARRSAPRWHVAFGLCVYGPVLIGSLVVARASVTLLPVGQVPSLLVTALAVAVLLAPACVLSGWIYGQLAQASSQASSQQTTPLHHGTASARAYFFDTLGAGVAGAVLALFALDHIQPFRIAALALCVSSVGAAMLSPRYKPVFLLSGVALSALLVALPLDTLTYRWHAPGQNIVAVVPSPRGALLVTESRGQLQVFQQRRPLLVPSDHSDGEQVAHLSAAMHPSPSRVLVIGVPPGNLLDCLLLHRVDHIDVVAGTPRVATLIKSYSPGSNDSRVTVHSNDERAWVRSGPAAFFDLIVVNAGAPTSVAEARLFSEGFYAAAKRLLHSNGVLAVTMPGLAAYASDAECELHATVATTLRTRFEHLTVLPADRTIYVASQQPIASINNAATTIAQRLADREIEPEFVTETWLTDRLSPERMEQVRRWSARKVPSSTDEHPVVYRSALKASLAQLGDTSSGVLAVLAITLLALVESWMNPRARPVSFSVATTGFTGLSMQLLLMLVYQTVVGALYRDVALVTSVFMAASCAGTMLAMRKRATMLGVFWADIAQLAVVVGIAVTIPAATTWTVAAGQLAVLVGALVVGVSTGAQIAVASRVHGVFRASVGGEVYAMDLVGASLAALVTVTFLVPWLGIGGAAWFVAGVKGLSSIALFRRRMTPMDEVRELRSPLPTLLLLLVVAGVILPTTQPYFMAWTMNRSYHVVVIIVLAGILAMAFEPAWLHARLVRAQRRLHSLSRRIGISPLRLFVLIALLPAAALPLGRCYFTVPYLFCHACPRPCCFGILRPYAVTTALLANLGDQRFCRRACPLGHMQTANASIASSRLRRFGRVAWTLRLLALALVVYLYFRVDADHQGNAEGVSAFSWFYTNQYGLSAWVIGMAGGLGALSFFLDRPFCESACPIGAASDLATRAEKRWVKMGKSPANPTE